MQAPVSIVATFFEYFLGVFALILPGGRTKPSSFRNQACIIATHSGYLPELATAISRHLSSNLESIARTSPRALFINPWVLIGWISGAPRFIGYTHIKESGRAHALARTRTDSAASPHISVS